MVRVKVMKRRTHKSLYSCQLLILLYNSKKYLIENGRYSISQDPIRKQISTQIFQEPLLKKMPNSPNGKVRGNNEGC